MTPTTSHAFHASESVGSLSQWWPRERFLSGDAADGGCPPEVIDVTGYARCLVYGPYLALEPGLWRAMIAFELCPDAARRRFVVQFGADPEYTSMSLPLRAPGRHEITLDRKVQPGCLMEVRILMISAGFHGVMKFFGARIERISADV